ncbi:hypothetical protein BBK36DRAFT_1200701 [Trichoderma citrinoviride]|uniref:Transcription regulator Rua1 C-terminal domain-containing protein n=1 Tax=Trichoderma citrinoviride TaxID=58853 RepID=A0A2T4BAF9_9HYPO|nr:hypothetical protein BBK36DRAFT_1200701 [Trichoderma citrinoviride]PTB66322.1 hypothetical protein BBK36DRAFT_1200701 [Trichoderma citrinoviride]
MEPSHNGFRQHLQKYFFHSRGANSNKGASDAALQEPSINTLSISDMPQGESMQQPTGMTWMPPASQPQQVPTTVQDNISYYIRDDHQHVNAWEQPLPPSSSSSMQQRSTEAVATPVTMAQGLYPLNAMMAGEVPRDANSFGLSDASNRWAQKPLPDNFEQHSVLDPETPIGQAYTTDDTVPILDLRYTTPSHDNADQFNHDGSVASHRMSGSSFAMSDMASYEDFSAALSENVPHVDATLSCLPQSRQEQVRTQSRGRASPSPRPSMRTAPYEVTRGNKTQRWSTGSYSVAQRRASPALYHSPPPVSQRYSYQSLPAPAAASASAMFPNQQQQQQQPMNARPPFMMGGPSTFNRNSMVLASQLPTQVPSYFYNHNETHGVVATPPTLPSHGLLRVLQSNGEPHPLTGLYADLSDPPDLFGCLQEEQAPPPPEDMNPSDPEMVPYEQELRFENDLYTPRWVRGHGNKREGWCGICKPGRWLVLKNSAFWYDKSFSHGISAATGTPFQEPLDSRRMNGNPDIWEGLCGSCNDWIPLVSSKKKGTTWFRHAYKCHTHPKAKDAHKRRRENSQHRPGGQMPQHDSLRPMTPQMSSPGSGMEASSLAMAASMPMPTLPMDSRYMPMQQQPHAHGGMPQRSDSVRSQQDTPMDSYPGMI